MKRLMICVGLVGLLSACGQTGEEGLECVPTSFTEFGLNDTTPLGFSAAEAYVNIEVSQTWAMTYANDDPTTDVTLDVARNGGVIDFIEFEIKSGSGMEPAAGEDCFDVVRLPVDVSVVSADGALAESRAHFLDAREVDQAFFWDDWQAEELQGSLDVNAFTDEQWDSVWATVQLDYSPGAIRAEVYGMGEVVQGSGPDGIAVAGRFDIATFGDPLE